MTTDDKNTSPTICLFFDELGNGPSESRLIAREVREVREGDKIAVPRAFGLCWTTPAPPFFVDDGGFMVDTETATWLRDRLTAWLDATRLAARESRESREVVAEIGSFRLLRTAFEWGVLWQDHEDDPEDGEETWYSSEVEAREAFRIETETIVCEACGRFVSDYLANYDEDGIGTCPDGTGCNVTTTKEPTQ